MNEPKLRAVNKATAPYDKNKFPTNFIDTFAKEIVYYIATKPKMSIEGKEWEQVFARCIGAEWKESNVGLDDVILGNCCWSAKTVKCNNVSTAKEVRLISGRNSPTFSYGIDQITSNDPDKIGELVLNIWNERVSAVREIYKFARTIVLVKSNNHRDFLIFETDMIRYDKELYYFKWNKNNNLEGYEKKMGNHKFTWQPSGSQFTIIENIPPERIHVRIQTPENLDTDAMKQSVLDAIHFNKSWYSVIK